MKLHNTLNRDQDLVPFTPLEPGKVRMYSCGPTVYDHIHIGNLRAFIVADTLRRVLAAQDLNVEHVMNFTDVDDKTIRRSQERYPQEEPLAALQKLTREYEEIFLDDMKAIGNDVDALHFVRATESIEAMQDMIKKLHAQGFAYITDDGIYFSIKAYQAAGKTYGQLLTLNTANTSESRIDNDEYDKESVHDFALWKKQKGSEPAWRFELDGHNISGRPGWHIECSAMSGKLLGQPFDIHTGGIDLIFPHHENEIAQSTATDDSVYAKYFVHNEHLLVDGKKMSKSLSNFYTLADIQKKGFQPMAFRLLALQSHYRSQMNFSWETLEAAENRLKRWQSIAVLRHQPLVQGDEDSAEALVRARTALLNALKDDMNAPEAFSQIETALAVVEDGIPEGTELAFEKLLQLIDDVFGLKLLNQPDISADTKDILTKRQTARDNKDWERSDLLRDQLQQQGITVRDTAHGQIWSRA